MDQALRIRKVLGGGMRQAGIIAAGALYAVRHHRDRLAEDHANAQRLAAGLHYIDGIAVNLADVQTNLVYFHTPAEIPATVLANQLATKGVGVLPTAAHTLRAVTNLMVTSADIDEALNRIAEGMREVRSQLSPETPQTIAPSGVSRY
jgi:threonine aldolase